MHALLALLLAASLDSASSKGAGCLANVSASPEEAAARFLDALSVGDEQALRALTVSRGEFEGAIWPWLPVSRPESNVTPAWAWEQYALRNEAALQRLLRNHAGASYRLVGLRFRGPAVEYEGFRLFEKPSLEIENVSGERQTVRLFGSLIEMNGFYKIYGFKND